MNGSSKNGRRPRHLPSVDDALQLMPFTSIVPFDAEMIPSPSALPPSLQSSVLSQQESQAINDALFRMNADSHESKRTSAQLAQALQDTRDILNSTELTQYKFRALPFIPSQHVHDDPSSTNGDKPRVGAGLSSFANMVLNETEVSYRYRASASPRHHPHSNGFSKGRAPASSNTKSVQANSSLSKPDLVNTGFPLSTPEARKSMAIQVPTPSGHPSSHVNPNDNLDELRIQHSQAPLLTSQDNSRTRTDQQERADSAFSALNDILHGLFQAEDCLEPDTSGAIPTDSQQHFMTASVDGQTAYQILPEIQTRLLNALAKLINLGKFHQVPIEDLVHLQRLCQDVQMAMRGLNLDVPEASDDESVLSWSENVTVADNSLRASRTLIKMMMGGREEKQLYSEDVLLLLLDNLKSIFESCLIPIVETRQIGKSESSSKFAIFSGDSKLRNAVVALLRRAGGLFKALGDLVMKVDLSEQSVATIEMLAVQLLFVENSSSEKDSILGLGNFEDTRRHGMETLAKVFMQHPEPSHRRSILNEILASLEKLPVGRQSARQYKVVNGKPIQVVSALVMLLIQISATKSFNPTKDSKQSGNNHAEGNGDDSLSDDDLTNGTSPSTETWHKGNGRGLQTPQNRNDGSATIFFESARNNANYIISFLLSRAQKVSKSSDEPYRNLLDIFTEDLVSVLGHSDWPAAEILLHHLFAYLVRLLTDEKSIAPIKVMALELLGSLGSGIADLQAYVLRSTKSIETDNSALDASLSRIGQDFLNTGFIAIDDDGFEDVQRAVLQFMILRDTENLLLRSAQGFLLASRTVALQTMLNKSGSGVDGDSSKSLLKSQRFAKWLSEAIRQPSLCETDSEFETITTTQGNFAYALVILASPFCKAFPNIINAFVSSLRSTHATVKSRALKSVVQLLEKNPQILDTSSGMVDTALAAAADTSPSVRDSALTLLGKCVSLKPALDLEICKHMLDNVSDPSTAVRKKQLRLFTEIYLRNEHKAMRAAIASAILTCVGDNESSISELAKATMEDIWIAPFQHAVSETELSPRNRQRVRIHAAHIIDTANSGLNMPAVLEALMRELLGVANKKSTSNRLVCKTILATMFDGVIDNDGSTDFPGQSATLRALTVFAKACPTLFDSAEMVTLRPYIENLSSEDDRLVYRSVVIIYRCVLPVLPPLEHKFLEGVQQTLLQSVSKLGKAELSEVAPCLWMVNNVLNNTARLAQFTLSIFRGIDNAKNENLGTDAKDSQAIKSRTQRYIRIAGPMGKAFDLSGQQMKFKEHFKAWEGNDIPTLMIDILSPFLSKKQPYEIRSEALEAVSLICQAWPYAFIKPQIVKAFEIVFKDQDAKAEQIVLDGILAFYEKEEARSKTGSDIPVGNGASSGAERLGKSLGIAAHDSAATSLAGRFLDDTLRISRASLDHLALTATLVIASINRQGLVHPKQCGSALVVLETSPNMLIAKAAKEQHKDLHMKHESMLGKEYVQAIAQVFAYQLNTVGDTLAVNAEGAPKLKPFFDVVRAGSVASRKKLYTDIVKKLDFNPNKSVDGLEDQLPYIRFVLENFALADFARLDEVIHLHAALEKMFTDTGNALAQLLEGMLESASLEGNGVLPEHPSVASRQLRSLSAAAIVLTMVWEARSYLRKTWCLPMLGSSKSKLQAKDASKAPSKSASASPELFLKRIGEAMYSLRDDGAMMTQCKSFLETLSIDNEYKVASDESPSPGALERMETPTGDALDSPGHKKRKMSASTTPAGRLEKKQRPSLTRKKSSKAASYAESDQEEDNRGGDWE